METKDRIKRFYEDFENISTFPELGDAKNKLFKTIQGLSIIDILEQINSESGQITAVFLNDRIICHLIFNTRMIDLKSFPIKSIQSININIKTEKEDYDRFYRIDDTKKMLSIIFLKPDILPIIYLPTNESSSDLLSFKSNLLERIK